MEQSEDRELKRISDDFASGIDLFRKRRFQDALTVFDRIVEEFKNSHYYSVLEIQTRSKVYKKICEAQLNPVKIEIESDEDYLFDGILHLNAGRLDLAQSRFNYLKEKKVADPYLDYLLSLLYLKKNNVDECLNHLRKSIEKDETYKIVAHNEPDYDSLFENQVFVQLTDMTTD